MAEATKAQLETRIGELEADLKNEQGKTAQMVDDLQLALGRIKELEETDTGDATLAKEAAEEIGTLTARVAELEKQLEETGGDQGPLVDHLTRQIAMLQSKLDNAASVPVGDPWTLIEQLAGPLTTNVDEEGDPDPYRVTADLARVEGQKPWFFVETINFRNDTGYDNNLKARAISVLSDRAFSAARLGVDQQGQYRGLPRFNPGNRLLVAVAILPGTAPQKQG